MRVARFAEPISYIYTFLHVGFSLKAKADAAGLLSSSVDYEANATGSIDLLCYLSTL